jgi:hypothetical protein
MIPHRGHTAPESHWQQPAILLWVMVGAALAGSLVVVAALLWR